jgi:hypothetical protein
MDPVPDPLLLRKAPGIEPGPLDPLPGTLTTIPQRRPIIIIIINNNKVNMYLCLII